MRTGETLSDIRVGIIEAELKYMNAKAYSPFHGGRPTLGNDLQAARAPPRWI